MHAERNVIKERREAKYFVTKRNVLVCSQRQHVRCCCLSSDCGLEGCGWCGEALLVFGIVLGEVFCCFMFFGRVVPFMEDG